MEKWQFFIQKQGDRSWYVFHSVNLAIWEGCYRVIARSHLPNTEVEIRVSYFHEESQRQPQIQKLSRRTNAQGLIPVIPFTELKAGVWQVQCSGNLIAEFFGQSWRHSITLQVMPHEAKILWDRLKIEGNPALTTRPYSVPIPTPATASHETSLVKPHPYSSPLVRQWMESQGKSLRASINAKLVDISPD